MRVKKKWLISITIHYFLSLIVTFMASRNIVSDIAGGFTYFALMIPIIVLTIKENKLFSPISANIIFDLSFALYLMMLVKTYEAMNIEKLFLVVSCSFIWKLSIVTSKGFLSNIKVSKLQTQRIDRKYFAVIISALFLVSSASMLFEWRMAGGVPALKLDSETFRFTVSYSSITHLLAIMNKVVAALIGVYLVNNGGISIRKDFILIVEMIVAELLMIGTSMRGEMIMAPCIIFIVYAIKYELPLKFYVIGVTVALAFIGFVPYYRMLHSYGISYIASMKSISVYPDYYMFTPLYQSFTNNFTILNLDFTIYPKLKNFGLGAYSILPEIPFLNLGSNLMAVQNEVLNNNFYSGLTATYLASWYADFGNIGCLAITVLYSKLTTYTYRKYLKEKTLYSLVWYAYTFYSSLWMFYNGTFSFVYLCYSLVMWLALNIKFKLY